jgi:hypothetical protein
MERRKLIVYLELEPEAEPVAGRISVDGTSNEFVGWLALMDVLAARLAEANSEETPGQA